MSQYYNAFISYGRADSKAFATKLYNDLTERGWHIWFDQNDIPLGVDFQNQIDDGIEKADNFLFIIAPHSVNSPYCRKEIELAVKHKKRIMPLLHTEQITYATWQERNPAKTEADWEAYQGEGRHSSFPNMHPEIGRINWAYFRENLDDYDQSLTNLIEFFHHQEDYVSKHTQILVQALEWERHHKQTRYLSIGKERLEAEEWLKVEFKKEPQPSTPAKKEQPTCTPTDLQCEFICESLKNANNLTTQVFLSYAEADREIMAKIRNSLIRQGITLWTKQTDLKTGRELAQAINGGIEGADNFVYLLSPDTINSPYCQQGLAHALSLNKRIIVLLIKPTDLEFVPESIRNLHAIDMTGHEDAYQVGVDKLIKELRENAVYYSQHKVLLVKALKWLEQNRNPSILLRGYNLEHYQGWLSVAREKGREKGLHPPTDLQVAFIASSAKQPPDLALDVFISYSRADADLARRLNDALQSQGKTTWFDQESIATGTDFQAEIHRGIEQSDNFLFIISPESVNSPYCADEVEYAKGLNKRFVTLLHRRVNAGDLHPELAKVQWLDFNRHGGDFYGNFSELVRTLDTDREYVREHTRKSQRALEWKRGNRSIDLLLRGSEYGRAYEWLMEVQAQNKQPAVNEEIKEFILESKAEVERLQKTERRRKNTIAAAVLGTIVMLSGLSLFSGWQTVRARKQSAIALARQLAAESQTNTGERGLQQRGTLLAVESMKKFQQLNQSSLAADGALRRGLSLLPHFVSQMNHYDTVWASAFSPDGKYIATASSDNTARVWESRTGTEVARLNHSGNVWAVAFSTDGKYIATASSDNTARVWESRTGTEVAQLSHDHTVRAVAFSADSKYLATASWDKTARVWSATTGKELAQLSHDRVVRAVAFSPDGKYLATASKDKTARVWSVSTGKEVAKVNHDSDVWTVAFSPDGKYLATASRDHAARVWWASTGKEVIQLNHDNRVTTVAFSVDGKYLATASWDKTARVWESSSGTEVARLSHDDWVGASAFSPDGKYLATASYYGTARVWELSTGKEVARLNHDGSVEAVAFSTDGKYLTTASIDHTARVWEYKTSKEVADINHDGPVRAVAFSADGKFVATASRDKTARVWESSTGREVVEIDHDGEVLAVAFSADGKYLATASKDGAARVWELSTGKVVFKLNHDDEVWAVAFSVDGKHLATVSKDKTVQLWSLRASKVVAKLNDHGLVRAVAFSADGKYLATASSDNTARVWELSTGKVVSKLNHGNWVNAVAFSADGKYLATASSDKTARVWEFSTDREVAKLNHDHTVWDVAFSADGKYLATASADKTARVWSSSSSKEVAKLNHDDWVWGVAFSADGKYLATASADKTARVHFLNSQDLINEACSRLRRNLTADEWQRYMNLDLRQYKKTCDNLPVHPSVVAELAKGGKVKEATAILHRALKLEPDIDLNPDTEEIENDPEAVARQLAKEN